MALDDLKKNLETIDGIELATTEGENTGVINASISSLGMGNRDGLVLHLTLSEGYQGDGDTLVTPVLDMIPRDVLPLDDRPERVRVLYDAIVVDL